MASVYELYIIIVIIVASASRCTGKSQPSTV